MENESKSTTPRYPNTQIGKTVAEFFAGIGLVRIALELEGWQVIFANDIAPDKQEMYSARFSGDDNHFYLGDIHQLDAACVPHVTLATASFPCNDLSLAGMRNGLDGKQSSAFWGFIHIIRDLNVRRPRMILLENVPGFLTSHNGADFHAALSALNELGYSVDAFMIDAERFVPQSRLRLFVIGVQSTQQPSSAAETACFYESSIRPKSLAEYIYAHPEIRWAIRQMPALPTRTLSLSDILEDLPESSAFWWNQERTTYLMNQMSEKHTAILQRMRGKRAWTHGTVFRRVRNGRSMAELRTDGIAGCLRTPRGGSGRQILVKAGYDKVKARLLTPRECARLMGAGDYPLDVPLNQAYFGLGDAVCVPVVQWIAKHYLNPLLNEFERCEGTSHARSARKAS